LTWGCGRNNGALKPRGEADEEMRQCKLGEKGNAHFGLAQNNPVFLKVHPGSLYAVGSKGRIWEILNPVL